jgi:hypothetical protein
MTLAALVAMVSCAFLRDPSAPRLVPPATDPQAAAASSPRAYVGLVVRDIPDVGCVVSWIDPGPLNGRGLDAPALGRPDLLVTLDGRPATAAVLAEVLASKSPGDTLTLTLRRANRRGPTLPTAIDHAPQAETITVELEDEALWTGTWKVARRGAVDRPSPEPKLLLNPALEAAFTQDPSLRAALDDVIAAQRAMSDAAPDARRLARVSSALTVPLALPELAETMVAPALAGLRPARLAATLTAEQLDAASPEGESQGSVPVPGVQSAIYALDFFAGESRLHMREALGDIYANEEFARAALGLCRSLRTSLLLEGPEAKGRLATIRRGADIDMNAIVAALKHVDADIAVAPDVAESEPEELPDELKGAVEGTVLTAQPLTDIGWAVVGGPGPNRYDLSKVAAVFDLGGDDTYTMSDLAVGMRVIIDRSGNDRYIGGADQGFACGVGGFFLVDDHAGNDRYEGKAFNAGAGCFGVGLLIDRGGDDLYEGTEWSLGAACWGAGLLLDLGGSDTYRAQFMSQGCGGPRGFGAIVETSGNDLYAVDGEASQYGTPATSSSFSQGVGFGIRRAAAGGVGMIADLSGDDRYIAGEFSQGGGYFFGLGLLSDRSGNDRYWGDRYGQGWAAHQASGALVDASGNDTYVARTAANQAAAWDQSTALLWDMQGSDSYQGDTLAQGSAAQQALAFLVDGGGSDHYVASSEIAQGHSGTNEYHFGQPAPIGGIFSFSLLFDLCGATGPNRVESDFFSTGRPAHSSIRLGVPNRETPAYSNVNGLFIDVRP